MNPIVEAEETIYDYVDPKNGSAPTWCYGNTCIARLGEEIFVSGRETLADVKPLNNTRWMLLRRGGDGRWTVLHRDLVDRSREPSPIGVFDDGRVFLSANPTLTPIDAEAGPAQPQIIEFSARDPKAPFRTHLPVWRGNPAFTEHSYRSFAVDGSRHEMVLFQNIQYSHAEWTFCDNAGNWSAQGQIHWPRDERTASPEPIRVCYPTVQLKDRAVYFCGVSDIIEPNAAWREYKFKLTNNKWDYDFRRLFFTWSRDITSGRFEPWIEIASRDATAGWIFPRDLWVDPDGSVHLLWSERAIDLRLRDTFFPNERQKHSLNHAIVRDGQVIFRQTLFTSEAEEHQLMPEEEGRFHVTPDGRLFVFQFVKGHDSDGLAMPENRLVELVNHRSPGRVMEIAFRSPVRSFFTATMRGGSSPSNSLDILCDDKDSMRYVRINLVQ